MDIVKTRLQNAAAGTYRGPIDCARTLLRLEGLSGFYKGLTPNLVGVTPEKALKLAVNEAMREALERPDGSISLLSEIAAGATAGFVQVIATNPMEIIKIRMQTMYLKPVGEQMSTAQVVKHLGLSGLYRGTPATLMRDVPFSFIIFPGYSNLKKWFEDANGHCSLLGNLSAGCVAAAVGAGAVTPFDVVKTRLQVSGGRELYGGGLSAIPKCFIETWRSGGISTLFAGVAPRMTVVGALFGISLLSFDVVKSVL